MHEKLNALNQAPKASALELLSGIYEHSDWIAEQALERRPFSSPQALKLAMVEIVARAQADWQLALVRAHPELAGKAMVSQSLTTESTQEQTQSGLTHCTPEEFERIQQLNAQYNAKFGWPFILAVRGPRGTGLSRQGVIAHFERRLRSAPEQEFQECLRQVHRIAELRINDRFDAHPVNGDELWDWHEALAVHSEPGYKEHHQLTVTYLTQAHLACAADLKQLMLNCGFDVVTIDAVGNVVGRYAPKNANAESTYLLTGSHYDSVRNAGKYDGRLGILVPIMCVRELSRSRTRLARGIEVVAFAEEEGQRFAATFLASSALVGDFDPEWLAQTDSAGITMMQAMQQAKFDISSIANLKRDPRQYCGFVEVHIEQGPVLNALGLPLGVVSAINGSARFAVEITGTASHAGTTPMASRQDALCAASELALFVEQRAAREAHSVATIGCLKVPSGSVNVIPGSCEFTLDIRAPLDPQREGLTRDIMQRLEEICKRRGVQYSVRETMRVGAAQSDPHLQKHWERAVTALGLPLHRLPSGAGHDSLKMHALLPQAMLFVRGENAGISHNPLESTTSDDMQLCYAAFMHLVHAVCAA